MTSGTCKVLVLSDIDAVEKLRSVVGAPDPTIGKIHLEIREVLQFFVRILSSLKCSCSYANVLNYSS